MKTPHWPLDRVKELAAKPNGLFVQVGRAAKFFPTRKEALDSARLVIASLTSGQFAHSVQLTFDTADVYGVSFNDGGEANHRRKYTRGSSDLASPARTTIADK